MRKYLVRFTMEVELEFEEEPTEKELIAEAIAIAPSSGIMSDFQIETKIA